MDRRRHAKGRKAASNATRGATDAKENPAQKTKKDCRPRCSEMWRSFGSWLHEIVCSPCASVSRSLGQACVWGRGLVATFTAKLRTRDGSPCLPCTGHRAARPAKGGGKTNALEQQLLLLLFDKRDKEVAADAAVVDAVDRYLASPSNQSGDRRFVILRGPPGIGKSTYAQKLLLDASAASRLAHVCSTDDFFTRFREDGRETYCYNSTKVKRNHSRNQERVRLAASLGLNPVIVDNTHMGQREMAPYIKIAKNLRYQVQIVEPHEVAPEWANLEFLLERNQQRTQTGKSIGKSILLSMLQRFEPSPGHELPAECKALRSATKSSKGELAPAETVDGFSRQVLPTRIPRYVGIQVHNAFGGAHGMRKTLWALVAEALEGSVDTEDLSLTGHMVPDPLHVTTFHRTELKRGSAKTNAVLCDACTADGTVVEVTIEAVALVVGSLACAVVSRVSPPIAAPEDKHLHVTLAVRSPWAPADSNALLQAILGQRIASTHEAAAHTTQTQETSGSDSNAKESVLVVHEDLSNAQTQGVKGNDDHPPRHLDVDVRHEHDPAGPDERGGLSCFHEVDLSAQWCDGPVRRFGGLRVAGRVCDAFLVRLPSPLLISGIRFSQG